MRLSPVIWKMLLIRYQLLIAQFQGLFSTISYYNADFNFHCLYFLSNCKNFILSMQWKKITDIYEQLLLKLIDNGHILIIFLFFSYSSWVLFDSLHNFKQYLYFPTPFLAVLTASLVMYLTFVVVRTDMCLRLKLQYCQYYSFNFWKNHTNYLKFKYYFVQDYLPLYLHFWNCI